VIGTSFDDDITGDAERNYITGGENQDNLRGLNGDDLLIGQNGDDRLTGDAGSDYLRGGRGADFMAGGLGRDSFVFASILDTGNTSATRDTVRDFVKGDDKMLLSGIDANTLTAGDQAFAFIDDDAFTGVAGQLRQETQGANTLVTGDINGDGAADFQIGLVGNFNLSSLDFVL
jgi:Ca2+-binding RTX toxin-like protein